MQCISRRWNVFAIGRNATELAFLPSIRNQTQQSPRYLSSTPLRLKAQTGRTDGNVANEDDPSSSIAEYLKKSEEVESLPREPSLKSISRTREPDSIDDEEAHHEREQWQIQKAALKSKFKGEAWNPKKRLSPDTIEGIRTMHQNDPYRYTTPVLAEHFKVSPEAIRRILKSKWQPSAEEAEKRRERWERRGERVWSSMAEIGVKPPKPWRVRGVGKAEPGDAPLWKGRRGRGSAGTARAGGSKDATTIRRDLVAEKAPSSAHAALAANARNSISSRIL